MQTISINYKELLEHSFKLTNDEKKETNQRGISRLEFLSDGVFDFTTYDSVKSELFARKAVEVCEAITNRTTFDYIKCTDEKYQWFLLMCNLPFFANKIDWSTSIRGAWWNTNPNTDIVELRSSYLYQGDKQLLKLEFTLPQWKEFIQAVIVFAELDSNKL